MLFKETAFIFINRLMVNQLLCFIYFLYFLTVHNAFFFFFWKKYVYNANFMPDCNGGLLNSINCGSCFRHWYLKFKMMLISIHGVVPFLHFDYYVFHFERNMDTYNNVLIITFSESKRHGLIIFNWLILSLKI